MENPKIEDIKNINGIDFSFLSEIDRRLKILEKKAIAHEKEEKDNATRIDEIQDLLGSHGYYSDGTPWEGTELSRLEKKLDKHLEYHKEENERYKKKYEKFIEERK